MSTKHLGQGSEQPPKQADKLRLYGMRFCPYVQRVRLALIAKGILYDEVLIDLKNKPDWLFKLHPKGLVPVLDIGDQKIIESVDIAEFIDEKYSDPPLYPKRERVAEDRALIQKFGKVTAAMSRAYNKDVPLQEFLSESSLILEEFEKELCNRGTTFFSGDKPGMVDLMMWPWIERAKLPSLLRGEEFNFPKEKYPKLVAWKLVMQEDPTVKQTIIDLDKHLHFIKAYFEGRGEYMDDEF